MLLTRLKDCRVGKGYSIRDLTALTGINPSNISRLENLKCSPHGKTVRILADALEVEIEELYKIDEIEPQPTINYIPATESKSKSATSFWVIENFQDEEPFRFDTEAEAQRLKERLGEKARIYEATSRVMAMHQHLKFLERLARGDYKL